MNLTQWEGKTFFLFFYTSCGTNFFLFHSSGIDVFVLDTGVYAEHLDFDGRATHSANMIKNEDSRDMGGHGKNHSLFSFFTLIFHFLFLFRYACFW